MEKRFLNGQRIVNVRRVTHRRSRVFVVQEKLDG